MPEVKPFSPQDWLDALRSGDYQEGTGGLCRVEHTNSGAIQHYCCLGVLCDLAVKAGVDVDVHKTLLNYFSFDDATLYPPSSIVAWAGLRRRIPTVDGETLSNLNDFGLPFTEIADLIEDNMDEVFTNE